jgi:ADP-ribose pyrophosphatase
MKLAKYTLTHERFDGGTIGPITRELVVRTTAVGVVPYNPQSGQFLLIEQFRLAAHLAGMPGWQREIIAGISDRGESPEDLARREAVEEANCAVTDLVEMFRYLPSPGMTNEVLIIYCGRMAPGAITGVHGLAEEHEDIRSSLFHLDQVPELLEQGHTGNGPLIMALQWMQLNRARLRSLWK